MSNVRKIPHGFKAKKITKGEISTVYANRIIREYDAGVLIIRTPKQALIIKRYLAAQKKDYCVKPKQVNHNKGEAKR
ncbi:MAG: hypothetical protein ACRC9X_03260 [Bacteroidales bacterium]